MSLIVFSKRGRVGAAPGGGGGGSGWAPNLPVGMTLVADSSFETFASGDATANGLDITNWSGLTTESASSTGTRSSTGNSGLYGSKSLRSWFPENDAGNGVGPTTITVGVSGYEHYMVEHMRFSTGYVFHTNSEKFFYPIETGGGGGNQSAALLNVGGSGQLIGYDGPIEASPVGVPKSADNVIPVGSWFTVEFYAKMNTPGNSDGELKCWVDGTSVLNQTGWQFSNHPSVRAQFNTGRRDMTRGGGVSSILTPSGGQWLEIDRLAFYER